MVKALVMSETDNVATLIAQAHSGDSCELRGAKTGLLKIQSDVPYGHKVALVPLEVGDEVIKYGQVIGRITQKVSPGEHVHIHNVESIRGRGDLVHAENA